MTDRSVVEKGMLSWRSALHGWAREYAAERGVAVSDVLETALENFRDDAKRGVPKIRKAPRASRRVRASGKDQAAASVSSRPAVVPPVVSVAPAGPAARVESAAAAVGPLIDSRSPGTPLQDIVAVRMGIPVERARRHVIFRGVNVEGYGRAHNPDWCVDPGKVTV